MVICIVKTFALQYYLTIGKPNEALKEALALFEQQTAYCFVGSIEEDTQRFDMLEKSPNLVLVNLDIGSKVYEIIEKLNARVGLVPKYIGITNSAVYGVNAFKRGFVDVVLDPSKPSSILKALMKYNKNYIQPPLFCVESYHDFQYINLKDVVLLKADSYISQFILKDGSIINNYKNLISTHRLLPINFQRIHRSYVINAFYVHRIRRGKQLIYLRHRDEPLRFTRRYDQNIIEIKKILSDPCFIRSLYPPLS